MESRNERFRPMFDGAFRPAEFFSTERLEELLLAGGDDSPQLDPAVHHRPVRSHRAEVRKDSRQPRRQVSFVQVTQVN